MENNFMAAPQIDSAKCTGCGLCITVCLKNGLKVVDNVVLFIGGDECNWCGMCEAVCENEAISCPYDIVIEETCNSD
jgi:MinD superfamily P-loop ATPase